MQTAANLARGSVANKRKSYFGAVVADKRRVIGSGINSNTQHPFLQRHYPRHAGIHAEACAIIHASRHCGDVRGLDLFVTRVFRTGVIAPDSKPCVSCMALMARFGIRRVFFVRNSSVQSLILNKSTEIGPAHKELGSVDILTIKA